MNTKIEEPVRKYGFWNWGTGITIVIITGALGMIFLVYKSMQVNFDLVERDYYAAELTFDHKKMAQQNAKALSAEIDIVQQSNYLIIRFPKECIGQDINGSLLLYRPSDQAKDIEMAFELDDQGIVMLESSKLIRGKYILKGNWQMNGSEYNVEKSFFIQK